MATSIPSSPTIRLTVVDPSNLSFSKIDLMQQASEVALVLPSETPMASLALPVTSTTTSITTPSPSTTVTSTGSGEVPAADIAAMFYRRCCYSRKGRRFVILTSAIDDFITAPSLAQMAPIVIAAASNEQTPKQAEVLALVALATSEQ